MGVPYATAHVVSSLFVVISCFFHYIAIAPNVLHMKKAHPTSVTPRTGWILYITLLALIIILLSWQGAFAGFAEGRDKAPAKATGKPCLTPKSAATQPGKRAIVPSFKKQLSFIENSGQIVDQDGSYRHDIDFALAAGPGLNIFVGSAALHYQFSKVISTGKKYPTDIAHHFLPDTLSSDSISMYRMDVELVGANPGAKPEALEPQDYYERYYTATVAERGAVAQTFNRIVYKDIYPHIDWVLYTCAGKLKHEFHVHPGGRVGDIRLKYGGTTKLVIDKTGALSATTPMGDIIEQAPVSYTADHKSVTTAFTLQGQTIKYSVQPYKGELVIDPTVVWATYFGGVLGEVPRGITSNASGKVFMVGYTESTSGIATSGAHQTTLTGTSNDAFVAVFSTGGVLNWATYLGGTGDDRGFAIAADDSSHIYICGKTSSTANIASPGAFQEFIAGTADGFVAKFADSGEIAWSTYFGGSDDDAFYGIVCDSGCVYACGETGSSSGIALPGVHQPTLGGEDDACLVKFSTNGNRIWATYFGGSADDIAYAVTLANGHVFIAGVTASTTGISSASSFQPSFGGGTNDGFWAGFDHHGSIVQCSYFGGGGNDGIHAATTIGSSLVFSGTTGSSTGISTPGAFREVSNGGGFLALVSESGMPLWSTYLGRASRPNAMAVAVNKYGEIFAAGTTSGPDTGLTTAEAFQDTFGGGSNDAYIAKFDTSGTRLWASYFGGNNYENISSICCLANGDPVASVMVGTSGLPSVGAHQADIAGGSDAYIIGFNFARAPIIDSISPIHAHPAQHTTIFGRHFNTVSSQNIVHFGATQAVVNYASDTMLDVTVPIGATFEAVTVLNAANGRTGFAPKSFLPTYDNSPYVPAVFNFDSAVNFLPATDTTAQIYADDIDGDGKTDIIARRSGLGQVRFLLFRNTGTAGAIDSASFAAPVTISVTGVTGLGTFTMADMDGDGRKDIVGTGLSGPAGVVAFILPNLSVLDSFSFGSVTLINIDNASDIVCDDINKDGRPDIIVAAYTKISLIRNRCLPGNISSALFSGEVDFTCPARHITTADMDGDGRRDIVVTDAQPSTATNICIFRNVAAEGDFDTSSLGSAILVPAMGLNVAGSVVEDIDGDGKPDISTSSTISGIKSMSLHKNISIPGVAISSASFSAAVSIALPLLGPGVKPLLADIDGDARPDFVLSTGIAGSISVIRNMATPGALDSSSFSSPAFSLQGILGGFLIAGDFDGDGLTDLCASGNSSVTGQPPKLVVIRNNPLRKLSGMRLCPGDVTTLTSNVHGGSWSSASTGIAAIGSVTGTLMAISPGTATISYTINTGFTSAVITVDPLLCSGPGIITTVAGSGAGSISGLGGPATSAHIGHVVAATKDLTGNLFLANDEAQILCVTTDGNIHLAAGNGLTGFTGDGGPATAARIGSVSAMVADSAGNIYFTDSAYHAVRKISATGIITSLAGNGSAGFSIDGTPATAAQLSAPSGIAVDATGSIIFWENQRIRKIDPAVGILSTLAGNGSCPAGGDGTPAATATICNGNGIALNPDGNLALAYPYSIRMVNESAIITTIAGTGSAGYSGDGGPATAATLNGAEGLSFANSGYLFVADRQNNCLRKISPGGSIETPAGNGAATFNGDGCPATATSLNHPADVFVDAWGKVYIADYDNYRVRVMSPNHLAQFANGPIQSLTIASGTIKMLDTTLSVIDGDNQQPLTWSVLSGPVNGTLIASGTHPGNGSTCYPLGFSYSPDGGFSGYDSFTVRVMDCAGAEDTTTVYVTVTGDVPIVYSVSPNPARPGDTVIISGLNFNPLSSLDIVYFGATRAAVSLASTDTIIAIVPLGAIHQHVTVTNVANGLTGSSPHKFLPTFDNTPFVPGIVNFDSVVSYDMGVAVSDIATGDIDGDGKADLVYLSPAASGYKVHIARNNTVPGLFTSASFDPPAHIPSKSGVGPYQVAIADMDGDGKVDIVVSGASASYNYCSVYRNISSAGTIDSSSFEPRVDLPTDSNANTVGVAISDLNRDGHPDIVCLNNTASTVNIFQNNCSPGHIDSLSFGQKITLPLTFFPTSLAIGDIDGDGREDIIVMSLPASLLAVIRNESAGNDLDSSSFAPAVSFSLGSVSGYYSTVPNIIIGSLSSDQRPEVGVLNGFGSAISILENAATPGTIDGTSLSSPINFSTGGFCAGADISDFDGDELPDIGVVRRAPGWFRVFRNNGATGSISSSSFTHANDFASTHYAYRMQAADLDGDTFPDVVMTDNLNGASFSSFSILRNDPLRLIEGTPGVCIGATTTLTNETHFGKWYSSDAAIATVDSVSGIVTGVAPGTALISFVVRGGQTSVVLTVDPLPDPGTISGAATICAGTYTSLSATVTTGAWSVSDSTIGAVNTSGIFTGLTGGTSVVSYTVTNSCGSSFATHTITINPLPDTGTLEGSSIICLGASILFSDTTLGGTWSSTAPSIVAIDVAGMATGLAAGTAIVSYTTTNGCGSLAASRLVTVTPVPDAGTITGPATVCIGSLATLSSSAPGGTWSSTVPARAAINSLGRVVGLSTGTTTISYALNNGCGIAYTTRLLTVVSPGIAAISGPSSMCTGTDITLACATAGGTWSSPSGSIVVDSTSGNVAGISAGSALVTYNVINGCGNFSATKSLTVNQSPYAGLLTGPGSVCEGSSIIIYNAVAGGTWSSSDESIATAVAPGLVSGISSGTATVSYTVTNICGANVATRNVTINPLPDAGSISGTAILCPGATTALYSSAGGGTWSSANTAVATISSGGMVTGIAPGTALISYQLTSVCGTDVASVVVTVSAYPAAGVISGPSSICEAATSAFSSSVAGGTWSSSAVGIASVSATGAVTGITPGAAHISYSVTNMCGTAISTVNVAVTPLPVVGSISGSTSVCAAAFTALSVSSFGGSWSSSAPLVASVSAAGLASGNNAGTCVISYTVTNGCGNAIATHPFTVNPLAPTGFIVGPSSVCLGTFTLFTDAVSGGIWSSSNPAIASIDASGSVSSITVGTARISYTTTNICGSMSATRVVTVSPVPAAINGPDSLCEGSEIFLWCTTPGGSFTGGTGVASLYNLGGGNARIVGVDPGTVTIRYVTNGCYSQKIITVNGVPAVAPVFGPSFTCPGSAVTFTVSSTGGLWTSGNTSVLSIDGSGNAAALSAGTSSVTYAITNSCGTAASSRTITVYPFPDPGVISGPVSVCAGGGTVTLTHTGMGSIWSSSNSSIATVTAPGIVTGISAGTVTISYTVSNACGTVFATKEVTVQPLPDAGILAGTTAVCQGSTTIFSSTTPGGTWSSESLAVASVHPTSGSITGISAGAVYITYTATNSCGSAYKRKVVTVNPLPDAGLITGSSSICLGSTTMLGHVPYAGAWSSGNPSVATISPAGIVSGVASGVADISYTVTNSCGTASAILQVSVNTPPLGGIAPAAVTLCPGATAAILPGTPAGTWTTTDAMVATVSPSGTVTAANPGTALISYRVSNICGTVGSSTLVTVRALPNAGAILGSGTVCEGSSVMLTNPVGPGTWSCSAPSIAAIGTSGNVAGLSPGTGTISFSVSNSCGTVVATKQLTVNPSPTSITGPGGMCQGQSASFYCSPSGGTWSSSSASVSMDALSGTGTSVMTGLSVISYSLPGGCSSTHTVSVSAQPASIAGALTVCEGESHALIPTPADASGTWTSSDIAIASFTGWSISGLSAGTTTITYTTAQGCSLAAVVTVHSLPQPITGSPQVCEGTSPAYTSLTTGGTWTSNSAALSVGLLSGVTYAAMPGTATLTYKVSGCSTSMNVSVNLQPAPIAGSLSVCSGAITILDNLYHGGTWSSSDPAVANFIAPLGQLRGISTGTAVVSYTLGNCAVTAVATVQPLPLPVTGDTIICVGATGSLSSSTAGGTWVGGGAFIALASGLITGIAPGTGTVSYVLPTGCYATSSLTVNPLPGTIGGSLTLCEGMSGALSISGITGGAWSSASPATLSVDPTSGIVTAHSPGETTLTYTLPSGCSSSATATVRPSVTSIDAPTGLCAGSTASLTGLPSGGTWSSDRPGIADVTATGLLSAASVGSAIISYWLHPACPHTDTISVYALPVPISGGLEACANDTAQLYCGPAGGSWAASGTSVSISASGAYSGSVAGTSIVTYSSVVGCTRTAIITINSLPATIVGPSSLCNGTEGLLISATAGGNWHSRDPLIVSVDALTGVISGTAPGTSAVSYTLPTGCSVTTNITVLRTPAPITGTDRLCQGTSAKFKNAVAGGNWSAASSVISVDAYGVVAAISPGAANVSYTLPNGCFTSTTVKVDALPATPVLSGNTRICLSDTAFMEAYPPGGTWSTSEPSVANMVAPGAFMGLVGGKAPLHYQWSNTCGTASASVLLEVDYPPYAGKITGDAEVCINKETNYASSAGNGYWVSLRPRFGSINTLGNFRALEPGTALLAYISKNECGIDTAKKYVEINGPDKCDTTTRLITGFNLYPNPSKGAFIFETPLCGGLTIYTADSRLVTSVSVQSSSVPVSLPPDLPAGVYMVRFIADNGTVFVAKLVLRR